ncbi:MAG: hypothetical protein IPK90_07875 [Chitinophagaceae bacterium]|nr:hypothetical protein [Chitinophagaceae bacterium]
MGSVPVFFRFIFSGNKGYEKIILSCDLLVTTLFCLAQIKGNVTISTTGTNNLKIKFGGKQYSLQDRSVTFQSLEPGNYSLIIYQLQQKPLAAQHTQKYSITILQ